MPLLAERERRIYQRIEPFYSCPVRANSHAVFLRNDAYGKGHFGASRNGGRTHKGIDFAIPLGEPVLSSKSGRVVFAGEEKGYGKYIELIHPDGLVTRYAHLSGLEVEEGAWVNQNRVIGKSGKTGNADHGSVLPHLHFEIRNRQGALSPTTQGLLDPSITIKS